MINELFTRVETSNDGILLNAVIPLAIKNSDSASKDLQSLLVITEIDGVRPASLAEYISIACNDNEALSSEFVSVLKSHCKRTLDSKPEWKGGFITWESYSACCGLICNEIEQLEEALVCA